MQLILFPPDLNGIRIGDAHRLVHLILFFVIELAAEDEPQRGANVQIARAADVHNLQDVS